MLMSFIHAGLTQETPKAVLKVTPDESVFSRETVTITCDIQGAGHIQWTYSWFKNGNTFYPHTTTAAEISFTAEWSSSGEYSCRGERSDSQISYISAAVTLTVSDSSRSSLTVTPDRTVFTGETVNLKCVIETRSYIDLEWIWRIDQTSNWRYEWYKDTYSSVISQTSGRYTVNRETLTIRGVITSDQGQYWCRGRIRSVSSQSSSTVFLSVKDSPGSSLTVTPDSPVFTGETVNLTCVIESHSNWRRRNGLTYDWRYDWTNYKTSNWRYEWYKDTDSVMLQTSDGYTVNRDTLTIRGVTTSDQGQYWCRGRIRSVSSQSSSTVFLSVKDSPRSSLTVTPDSPVFTGETVTLTCVIETHSNWRYEWYKDTDSVMLQTSDRYTVDRDTLTIRGVTTSDQGQYWCRGQRDQRPNSSQSSSVVYLSVKDSPRSSLTVTPDSPVFTGETVNLTCVIETHSNWRRRNDLTYDRTYDWTPEWRYEWYKDTDSVMLQTSGRSTVNRYTLTIRGVITSDQGQYWCRGQRDQRPNSSQSRSAVSLTVTDSPRSSLTVTPDSPVFTGDTVNLTCVIESHSNWRYEWYKDTDSVMLQTSGRYTVNRDTLTIRGVITSDQGQYWCRGQRDQRPISSQDSNRIHLSVNGSGQISVFSILSFLLAACPYLLSTVVLLFKCYRARVTSTEDQSQYAVTEEQTSI
ncbi:basement membrane-specific heparan sulfate proteoglycan core protein-like isoform X2 [Carassius gibelio]|uniref:basement membrane-specific heparan sulfate proteoglycan core protein-like isoform X2 n=1 Tax=Carassius gibelio TaxID=101364 RepID=UPI0022776315|nr:basement membrane-specific heparan sulfate proteoglycan core protein-like isoform X2 [Carassius gibelio]